ncbi:hypothetical protein TDB9533_04726 [Thalassocella blandensis]|nr:hypothetical protein TDB9533_04726 [Thalassocella blandensis]
MIRIFAICSLLLFAGCASNPMIVAPQQTVQQPDNDKSQVVFMRSSFVGSAINASLYDVTNGEIKYLGIIANNTKIAYETTPGKHTFMVVSEAADFMEAELGTGKNYFSIATPRMGAWKARFSLWPIKKGSNSEYHTDMPECQTWVSNTKLMENTAQSKAWYEKNKNSVKQKYDKYYPAWKNKSEAEIEKRTLNIDDGL